MQIWLLVTWANALYSYLSRSTRPLTNVYVLLGVAYNSVIPPCFYLRGNTVKSMDYELENYLQNRFKNRLYAVCENLDTCSQLTIVIIIISLPSHDRRHCQIHNYYNCNIIIKNWIIGQCNLRLFIGLAVMVDEPIHHKLHIKRMRQLKFKKELRKMFSQETIADDKNHFALSWIKRK